MATTLSGIRAHGQNAPRTALFPPGMSIEENSRNIWSATPMAGRSPMGYFEEHPGRLLPPQQLWRLGDVGGDPPRRVARHQPGRRSPAGFIFEVDIGERVPVGVADDVAPLPGELRVRLF